MRIAALYDIHGNLPALDAVLDDVRRAGVDRIVIGGDVVPGPMPSETLARVRQLDVPAQYIRGNGDRVVVAERTGGDISEVPEAFRDVVRWNAKQLLDDDAQLLGEWPLTLRLAGGLVGDVLFCHATPRNDMDIFTKQTAEERLLPIFDAVRADLVVCGHTHMQFDRMVGTTRVVNAGSVGMPFGRPGAYWLLIDGDVELRRTEYDLAAAADRVRHTAYPQAEYFAANSVLQPPREEAMLDAFAKAEVR
jgi:putative phosphoesterase